jgi:hypothetical protein
MTFPFFKSTLDEDEAFLASLILDNFNLKRDLIELEYGYFKSHEISEEVDIEITILSIAILSIHRPNFITDKRAELIEQTFIGVISWMTKFYHKYTSDCRSGQIYFATTKLDTYKKELQNSILGEKGNLPWHIYSSIFHFPLQHRKVEENEVVLERLKNFNHDLYHLISKYTEVAFKCFEELHPCNWYVFDWEELKENHDESTSLLHFAVKRLKLDKYQKEKLELLEKYKKSNSITDSID